MHQITEQKSWKAHFNYLNCSVIVRIEFSPVVEIGVSKGHYFPQETTNKGPTLTNAWACYNPNNGETGDI